MRIWLDKTVDEEFEDLGTSGYTGTLNDRQYAVLGFLGHTGALADRMGAFIAGGRSIDITAPVLSGNSFNDTTDAATFTTTEGGTFVWATHLTTETLTANGSGGWTGSLLESGTDTVASSGETTISAAYTATTGTGGESRKFSYYVRDASGNDSNVITETFTVNSTVLYNLGPTNDTGAYQSSVTLTLPTYSENDLLVAFVGKEQAVSFSGTPSGWTQFATMDGWASTNGDTTIWYKVAAASESNPQWTAATTKLNGGFIIGFPGMAGLSGFASAKSFSKGTYATPAHAALAPGDYAVYCGYTNNFSNTIVADTPADVVVDNETYGATTTGHKITVEIDFTQADAGAARTFGDINGRAVFQIDA